jgi:hypothetical protein
LYPVKGRQQGVSLNNGKEKYEMFGVVIYLIAIFAFFFWLIQFIDLLFRHPDYFDNHTHKLAWFIALLIGNIIAAVWYFFWKREAIKEHDLTRFRERAKLKTTNT